MSKQDIFVVVPTIREDKLQNFLKKWIPLFKKHCVRLIVVKDGEIPEYIEIPSDEERKVPEVMGDDYKLVSNFNASIRNAGFYLIAKEHCLNDDDIIITLDDDTEPIGDPIQDHVDALNQKKPISWLSTTIVHDTRDYMRGFPYAVREEAEVVLSHGVWHGVPDRDALSQLVSGERRPVEFYKGPIPKGVFFPFCGMNVAFKAKALPYVYYAPVGDFQGCERFDDIWGGIEFKKDFDAKNWAIVTGYAQVKHDRASDPFKNLSHEYIGLKYNEELWQGATPDAWFKEFAKKKKQWKKIISDNLS